MLENWASQEPLRSPRTSGGLTSSQAAQAQITDLLDAERELRQMAEMSVRDLRAALQMAAYTFAGKPFEEEIRESQVVVEQRKRKRQAARPRWAWRKVSYYRTS